MVGDIFRRAIRAATLMPARVPVPKFSNFDVIIHTQVWANADRFPVPRLRNCHAALEVERLLVTAIRTLVHAKNHDCRAGLHADAARFLVGHNTKGIGIN